MSLSNLAIEETPEIWGLETPQTANIVRDAIRKESVIKYDCCYIDGGNAYMLCQRDLGIPGGLTQCVPRKSYRKTNNMLY